MLDTKEALAERAQEEAMACIGCHDCMLACPLAESQIVSIAELNDAIHLPTITNPKVVQFVTACTQCQQCVPVCPADLSRADMVLYNKMKVEDSVVDQAMWLQHREAIVPSGFTLDGLAGTLTRVKLFAGVAQEDLRRMLLSVTLRHLDPHEILAREGDFHERLVVVLDGALEQSTYTYGHRVPVLVLPAGGFYGELAIMADQAEPFTVVATMPTTVVEIPKAAATRLMDRAPAFRSTMEDLYRRRALWTYSQRPASLGSLPEHTTRQIMEASELVHLPRDATLLEQDGPSRDIYLVRSGFLRVSRMQGGQEIVLTYLGEGELWGAIGAARGEAQSWCTIRASSTAEVIKIPGGRFTAALRAHPQAREAIIHATTGAEPAAREQARYAFSNQPAMAAPPKQEGRHYPTMVQPLSMDILVNAGLAQGSEVLVVDQNRCVHCRACIDACGRRHGHSRLELLGLQLDNLLFPTACRHCDDPVCLLCSVQGIVRLPEGEISIVEDNCIGCGACAERCPYGNIRMHPAEKPKRGILRGIWSFLTGPDPAPEAIEVKASEPKVAVKCDLCAGYDDYACVSACPVGAAARLDPAKVLDQAGGLIAAVNKLSS